jgi:hypothetical protein
VGELDDHLTRIDIVWRIAERRVLEAGIGPRREAGSDNLRRPKG